jgi:hypothetical protein
MIDRTFYVRRDGYGDLIYVRPQDQQGWMNPGVSVLFNIAFNYKGALAFNLRLRV